MDTPMDPPSDTERMLWEHCGLFDTGKAVDAKLWASSAVSPDNSIPSDEPFSPLDFGDLFGSNNDVWKQLEQLSSIESNPQPSANIINNNNAAIKHELDDLTHNNLGFTLNQGTDCSLLGNDDFLEQLTDLSSYLPDGCLDPANIESLDIFNGPSLLEGSETDMFTNETKVMKRTASEAFVEDDSVFTPISDHLDYTVKPIKRPRSSTITSESDRESVVSTSTTVTLDEPHAKDRKYRERRQKNNIASRRSREVRKEKHSTMEQKAIELETANEELRKKAAILERLAKTMKDILVQKLAGGCTSMGTN